MSYNCPVCDKAGIPNYKDKHTICPQCNTDLEPFLLVHSLRRRNPYIILFILITIIVISSIVLALYYHNSSTNIRVSYSEAETQITRLKDSIRFEKQKHESILYNFRIAEAGDKKEKEVVITYKVKKGDYPAKIAGFFYNDWRMYKRIETDNNLVQPYVLVVGQPLIIKIKP